MPRNRKAKFVTKTKKCSLCKKESVTLLKKGYCLCGVPDEFFERSKIFLNGKPTLVKKVPESRSYEAREAYKKAGGGILEPQVKHRLEKKKKPKKRTRQALSKNPKLLELDRKKKVKKGEKKCFASRLERKIFYESWEWKAVRYEVLKQHGAVCMMCGADRTQARICVDHIKPLGKNWQLRLTKSNLQVLCNDCNMGKSDKFEDNFKNPLTAKTPQR